MNLGRMLAESLGVGLVIGAVYGFLRRVAGYQPGPPAGETVVVRWSKGLGNARVVTSNSRTGFVIGSPLMRQAYPLPEKLEKVGIKSQSRGAFSARIIEIGENGWKLERLR